MFAVLLKLVLPVACQLSRVVPFTYNSRTATGSVPMCFLVIC